MTQAAFDFSDITFTSPPTTPIPKLSGTVQGGVLVWLGQDGRLLKRGLCDLFTEAADLVPQPWAGFLRWSGTSDNLACFRSWEPYRSDENWEPRRRPPSKRRR